MKKIFLIVSMVMVILVTCATPVAFADALSYDMNKADYYVYVKTPDGGLNMRSGPGTDYKIISPSRIPDDVRLYIGYESNGWGLTTYNGVEGWVSLKQTTKNPQSTPAPTKKPAPTPTPAKQPAGYYVYVNAPDGGLNLRTGPGTEYNTVNDYSIPNNTCLYVEEVIGTWGYITYDGREGWVALKQTTKAAPESFQTPSQEDLTQLNESETPEESETPTEKQDESQPENSEEKKTVNSSLVYQISLISILLLLVIAASLVIVIIINSKKKQQ